jgi:hypothetical protein
MLAIIGYTAIVQPSGKALDAALDNFLALWAIVVIPCAILMLASLLTRSPLRYNWSIRLIGISMIGIFAGTLLVILPLNTVLTLSRSPSAWAGLLLPRAMTLSPLASSFWQRAPTGAIGPRCWRLPSSSPSR